MAITIPDQSFGSAANGGDVTIDLSLLTVVENDYVVVIGGHTDNTVLAGLHGPSTAGYTEVDTVETVNATVGVEWGVWYKKMGATPDTTVVCQGPGTVQDTTAYAALIIQGADLTTFLDTAATKNGTPTEDGTPFDGPSITTVTDGALVISAGFDVGTSGTGAVTAAPTGYTAFTLISAVADDSRDGQLGVAGKLVGTAGAEDPGAFTDDYVSEFRSEITIAIRPAVAGGGGSGNVDSAIRLQAGLNVSL